MVAESTVTSFDSKKAMYDYLDCQFQSVLVAKSKLSDFANLSIGLANASSMLFYSLNALADTAAPLQSLPVNWVGFYLLQSPLLMTLGPFQGRVACTEIRVGKGVCGTAVATAMTQLVRNVHLFPGHIACDGDSESELVVPIRNSGGAIVGVLDVDSTRLGFFDDEDQRRMEQLAEILGKTFVFPFALLHEPRIPHQRIEPVAKDDSPEQKSVVIGDWSISINRRRTIAGEEERKVLETKLSVLALPEILFPLNQVTIANAKGGLTLTIDAAGAIRNAIATHRVHPEWSREGLRIRSAPSWAESKFEKFDANVDWAWRSEYDGDWRDASGNAPSAAVAAPGDGINWPLLRDQSQPLLLFDHLELFEDDLHDCGTSELTVKVRVMPTAFFVLLRHFVRVDLSGATVRETRIFHELSKKQIVVETSAKLLPPEALAAERVLQLLHHGEPTDELVTHMVTTDVHTMHIDLR